MPCRVWESDDGGWTNCWPEYEYIRMEWLASMFTVLQNRTQASGPSWIKWLLREHFHLQDIKILRCFFTLLTGSMGFHGNSELTFALYFCKKVPSFSLRLDRWVCSRIALASFFFFHFLWRPSAFVPSLTPRETRVPTFLAPPHHRRTPSRRPLIFRSRHLEDIWISTLTVSGRKWERPKQPGTHLRTGRCRFSLHLGSSVTFSSSFSHSLSYPDHFHSFWHDGYRIFSLRNTSNIIGHIPTATWLC